MSDPIRIGVQLWPGGAPDYATWRDAVLRAEEIGVDAVFGYDHFHKPWVERTPDGPVLLDEQPDVNNFEGWTAIASWGELTSKVEIGLLVTAIGFRNPDLLADMARTVDHISGGRLILGLGAGWYEKDYSVYGYPYPSLGERMDIFAEGLERIDNRLAALTPAPLRDIPILIGGSGEKRTLPLVGRYADIWHSFLDLEAFRRKNELVREHAAAAGRDEAAIERSTTWPGSVEEAEAYRAEGVSLFTWEVRPIPPQADSGWIGEVGPGPSYLDPGSGGPENDFTNRNTTFAAWNMLHLARMLKDAGGIPAHGNQRPAWDAGCRPGFTNPDYRS